MFNLSFGLTGRSGPWKRAADDISELPKIGGEISDATKNLLLVAGGLALVLSRCHPKDVKREYPNASELYKLLRSELRRNAGITASTVLILDTMHEVSDRLDPTSRRSLKECFEAARIQDLRQDPTDVPALAPKSGEENRSNSRFTFTSSSLEVAEVEQQTLPLLVHPSAGLSPSLLVTQ